MKALGAPYAVVPELIATPWQLMVDGLQQDLGPSIDDWDPSRNLELRRTISIDPQMILQTSGLGVGSRVRLVAGWHCDATRTREFTHLLNVTLDDGAPFDVDMECSIEGHDVAVAVTLETRLVLLQAVDASPIAASDIGASLWDDAFRVSLEGLASRFPAEWIDFSRAAYPTEAAWYLDWSPDFPEYSVLGGIRLYLNSSQPKLRTILEGDGPDAALLRQTMRLEIARQMLAGGLTSEVFVENAETFEEETVGAAIRRLVNVVFIGDSIQAARDLMRRDPGRFEAQLQAQLGYLSEEEEK